jgi:hypothetical protein
MDDLKEIAAVLCERLDVVPPRIAARSRTQRGAYSPTRLLIKVPKVAWRGRIPSFLHEFAHHHQYCKNSWAGMRAHGKEFRRSLVRVVKAHYGNLRDYPWQTEYRSVVAYGNKQLKKQPEETTKMYTKADRQYTSMLFKKYYPEDYLRVHGNKALTQELVKATLTRKEQLLKAKELKIPYFNSMLKDELAQAIELAATDSGSMNASLRAIVEVAKARFWEHRKKYQLGKKSEEVSNG